MARARGSLAVLVLVAVAGCLEKPSPWVPSGGDTEVRSGDQRTADGKGEIGVNPGDGGGEVPPLVDIVDVRGDGPIPVDAHDVAEVALPDAADAVGIPDAPDTKDLPGPNAEVAGDIVGDADAGAAEEVENTCVLNCDGKECGQGGCGEDDECGKCPDYHICLPAGVCECIPQCEGKQCGPNGCNGSCGDCGANQECSEAGQCECLAEVVACGEACCAPGEVCYTNQCCLPDCTGKECGSDGCGGECAICQGLQDECVAGACVCQPACQGKECGSDGCGGNCGGCGVNEQCDGLGMCKCNHVACGEQCCASGEQCHQKTGVCCAPLDCKALGHECGQALDGCGAVIDCGGCPVDPDICNGTTTCANNKCDPGAPLDCKDGNLCTYDLCDAVAGCYHLDKPGGCDDGDACTVGDTCVEGECAGGPPPDCDDGDKCTQDSCHSVVGCINDAIAPCCGNGIVELGEQCDDENGGAFCSPGCKTHASLLWRSGHADLDTPVPWCGESGMCAVAENNRWTMECTPEGDWPGGLWMRWVSPDGTPVGPRSVPDFETMVGIEFQEGNGGVLFGRHTTPEGKVQLLAAPVGSAGEVAEPKSMVGDDSFQFGYYFDSMVTQGSLWAVWAERSSPDSSKKQRVMARRFKLDGTAMYPAQNVTGTMDGNPVRDILTAEINGSICLFWVETHEPQKALRRACLNQFGALAGSIHDVLQTTSGYLYPTQVLPLSSGKSLLLASGESGQFGDSHNQAVRAVLLDSSGDFVKHFQVNQMEQGAQQGLVGAELEPGVISGFWKNSADGSIRSISFTEDGVVLTDETVVSDPLAGSVLSPALAMSSRGNGWVFWKALGSDGVFRELWGLPLRKRCQVEQRCRTSSVGSDGQCSFPASAPEGTLCIGAEPCDWTGLCDAGGNCIADVWGDGTDCTAQETGMDEGACAAGTCQPKPSPCPQETACTSWKHDWLQGCLPVHKCCGNGKLDESEPCDDGAVGSDWCSADCMPKAVPLIAPGQESCWQGSDHQFDELIAHDDKWYVAWAEGAAYQTVKWMEVLEDPDAWQVLSGSVQGAGAVVLSVLPASGGGPSELDVLWRGSQGFSTLSHSGGGQIGQWSGFTNAEYIECETTGIKSACFFPMSVNRGAFLFSYMTADLCTSWAGSLNPQGWHEPGLAVSPLGRVAAVGKMGTDPEHMRLLLAKPPKNCDYASFCNVGSPANSGWANDNTQVWLDEKFLAMAHIQDAQSCGKPFGLCYTKADMDNCIAAYNAQQGLYDEGWLADATCSPLAQQALAPFTATMHGKRFLSLPSASHMLVFGLRQVEGHADAALAALKYGGTSFGEPTILASLRLPKGFTAESIAARIWKDKYLGVMVYSQGVCRNIYLFRLPLEYIQAKLN